ncbi:hypothetical protein [Polyangium sp. 15x6]|uniref:hypothetical protein n=1 Tax=Polyangium sp. 15x6 TaxID=3042687 RepID=UPI00249BCA4D|nr:hypothetical protein [Polyangium sp. 15x6]MDI3283222.1 hypothetical protein [Polyangium sp. 15x6]
MSNAETLSRQTLEETPARVLAFLRGVGTSAVIRTALAGRGYSAEEHAQGWELLHRVSGYRDPKAASTDDTDAQKAIAALDAWDEPNFRVSRAALERLHPAQAAFVFDGLEAQVGAGAVLSVRTFLDRLDALESAPERTATRNADLAALATLAKRGITKDERKRVRKLVESAQAMGAPAEADADSTAEARRADLVTLRAWFDDWSETARTAITRRDHLIRLGLAKRKKAAKRAEGDEEGKGGAEG